MAPAARRTPYATQHFFVAEHCNRAEPEATGGGCAGVICKAVSGSQPLLLSTQLCLAQPSS